MKNISKIQNAFHSSFSPSSRVKRWLYSLSVALPVLFHCSSWGLTVDDGVTPQQMAQCIMGPGITVNNAVYTGVSVARGSFFGGLADGLDFDHGVILSTGDITFMGRGSDAVYAFGVPGSTDNVSLGDPDMTSLIGIQSYDAAVLEFDVITPAQALSFSYVFASNEYTDYIDQYNDSVAIFVDHNNIASAPVIGGLVSVNTINPGSDGPYYIGNENYPASFSLPFDGFTTTLVSSTTVTAGTHHIKIVIADALDQIQDSAILLQGSCNPVCDPPVLTQQPQSVAPCPGSVVKLHVDVVGTAPFTFQWKKNGISLANGATGSGSTIHDATTATLEIDNISSADEGDYQVVVNNSCGSVTSQAASLTINNGRFVAVAGGTLHSLFLRDDGTVWATGNNQSGQLGTGSPNPASSNLVQVASLNGVSSISTCLSHNLAIAGGAVWAWGLNANGQLGDGTTTLRKTPIPISSLNSGVTAVAAGYDFSLALKNGTVWAWGNNANGQLGDGTTVSKSTPVQLPASAFNNLPVTAISANRYHAMALTSDGTLWVWGMEFLGNNTPFGVSTVPLALPASSFNNLPVTAISAGFSFSLALTSDGTVWSWGANFQGQCGDGTTVNKLVPTAILTGATAVSGGVVHSLAVLSNGTIKGWGGNTVGQLGQGVTSSGSLIPISIGNFNNASGWSDAVAITAGATTSFAVTAFHTVWDWGNNVQGMLGNGTTVNQLSPILITSAGPPVINTQPPSLTVACYGSTVTLSVKANGSPGLTYQWQFYGLDLPHRISPISGTAIFGSQTASLTLFGVNAADSGPYQVIVTDSCGAQTSIPAVLHVGGPEITTQPVVRTDPATGHSALTVAAAGSAPLSYQWYLNDVAIPGAVLPSYQITPGQGGNYYVIVSSPCGAVQSQSVPVAYSIINVQFGVNPATKTGIAAIGNSASDHWNVMPVPNKGGDDVLSDDLLWTDSQVSPTTLFVTGVSSDAFTVADDPLLNTFFIQTAGGEIDMTLNNLAAGTYDIYLYGTSGQLDSGPNRWIGQFSIESGVDNPPAVQPLSTSPDTSWDMNTWVEGNQYVVFRDLQISDPNIPVVISVNSDGDHHGMPVVNGLQILRKQ
jgi:alpha-tubulin suppressor-like RCC1 family protein